MTDPLAPAVEAACKVECANWPKPPDGCAAICMSRLGSIPKTGCVYAVDVHGKRVRAALSTLLAAGFRVVPVEPTDHMNWAGNRAYPSAQHIYRAMLAAFPEEPSDAT